MTKESKSTEVATLSDSAKAFMAAAESGDLSISTGGEGLPFPVLNIIQENMQKTDTPEELDIPFGSFNISGTNLISDEITFRPIVLLNKVIKRGGPDDNYKVLSETIFFNDWKTERLDSTGGVDCGRKFGKDMKDLTQEEQDEERKKASLFLFAFGMVTFPDAEPQLVLWRMTGGKMMRFTDAVSKKVIKSEPYERNLKVTTVAPDSDPLLTPKQRKEARNTYVNIIVEPDMSTTQSLSSVAEEGGVVMEYVENHNKSVLQRNTEAVRNRNSEDSEYVDADFEVLDNLDD